MEDEVLNTAVSSEPTSDVVEVAPSQTQETLPPMESENPVTPEQPGQEPLTQREQDAIDYIEQSRTNSIQENQHSVSQWILNKYDYDPQQAGTMWVAGKINDVNTQMSFLEATLNEAMYDELDLQKYFFDQNLATARAYAKQKKFETAYGFYRAAQEKALAEGDLTGWYMPAEGTYMLGQWTVAEEILNDPNATEQDKARAKAVATNVKGWFDANNITERGIKCLNMQYLEETIRHNKENERLQEQANEIQRKANEANAANSASSLDLQLREWKFNNDQMELQFGYDIDEDGVIGFKNSDYNKIPELKAKDFEEIFGQFKTVKEWALNDPTQAFRVTNREYMKSVLGDQYLVNYNAYLKGIQDSSWLKAQYDNNKDIIPGENIDAFSTSKIKTSELDKVSADNKALINDATIKIIRTDNGAQLWVFDKNGTAYQITDESITLLNGKTVGDVLTEQGLTLDTNNQKYLIYKDDSGNEHRLNIGVNNYSVSEGSISNTKTNNFLKMSEKAFQTFKNEEKKGSVQAKGIISTENLNTPFVIKTDDGKYKEVNDDKTKDISNESKLIDVHINPDGSSDFKHIDGSDLSGVNNLTVNKDQYLHLALEQAEKVGSIPSPEFLNADKVLDVFAYTNSDGSTVFITINSFYDTLTKQNIFSVKEAYSQEDLASKNFTPLDNINLPSYVQGKEDYVNKVINTEEYKKTDTVEGIVTASEKKNATEKAENAATIKSYYSSSPQSSTTASKVAEPTSSKSTKTKTEIKKLEYKDTDYSELLGDKGNTLFTEDQIKRQNERLKESQKFLESI